jgi:hypothetical protein
LASSSSAFQDTITRGTLQPLEYLFGQGWAARPRPYTKAVVYAALTEIKSGTPVREAADTSGIPVATLNAWLQKVTQSTLAGTNGSSNIDSNDSVPIINGNDHGTSLRQRQAAVCLTIMDRNAHFGDRPVTNPQLTGSSSLTSSSLPNKKRRRSQSKSRLAFASPSTPLSTSDHSSQLMNDLPPLIPPVPSTSSTSSPLPFSFSSCSSVIHDAHTVSQSKNKNMMERLPSLQPPERTLTAVITSRFAPSSGYRNGNKLIHNSMTAPPRVPPIQSATMAALIPLSPFAIPATLFPFTFTSPMVPSSPTSASIVQPLLSSSLLSSAEYEGIIIELRDQLRIEREAREAAEGRAFEAISLANEVEEQLMHQRMANDQRRKAAQQLLDLHNNY